MICLKNFYLISDYEIPFCHFNHEKYKIYNTDKPKNEKHGYGILSNYFPLSIFPDEFHDQAEFMHNMSYYHYNLHKVVPNSNITYYDYIVENGLPKSKFLLPEPISISEMIFYYDSFEVLRRFFHNKGDVFHSMTLNHVTNENRSYVYPKLHKLGVLRTGSKIDLANILKFKTKKELIEFITFHTLDSQEEKLYLNSLNKSELINFLLLRNDVANSEIETNFYLLSEDFFKYKKWVIIEDLNFEIINMFYTNYYPTSYRNIPLHLKWKSEELKKLGYINLSKSFLLLLDKIKLEFTL